MWRSMETAPSKGEILLRWIDERTGEKCVSAGFRYQNLFWAVSSDSSDGYYYEDESIQPTGWQPMPSYD